MKKILYSVKAVSQKELCPGIFDLRLSAPELVQNARAGQFVNVFLNDRSRLLPRPVSICEIKGTGNEKDTLRLVYRVTGEKAGTAELSSYAAGTQISLLGPLGNGFPLEKARWEMPGREPDIAVVGGGIGIPPLLELCHELPCRKTAVLGYRNENLFLKDEFDLAADRLLVATEDGSYGIKGNVLDAMKASKYEPTCIMACGPLPMLRALKQYAAERNIPCFISMEERMACGVGVCLGCVVKSAETDPHSCVKNKRVCKDGPVFKAEEVDLT